MWVVILVRSRILHCGALRWIVSLVCWKQHAKYDEVVATVVEVEGRYLKDNSIYCSLCRCHTDTKVRIFSFMHFVQVTIFSFFFLSFICSTQP